MWTTRCCHGRFLGEGRNWGRQIIIGSKSKCLGKEGWEDTHGRLLFQACLFKKVFLLMVFLGVLSRNDGLVHVSISSIAQR